MKQKRCNLNFGEAVRDRLHKCQAVDTVTRVSPQIGRVDKPNSIFYKHDTYGEPTSLYEDPMLSLHFPSTLNAAHPLG